MKLLGKAKKITQTPKHNELVVVHDSDTSNNEKDEVPTTPKPLLGKHKTAPALQGICFGRLLKDTAIHKTAAPL